MKIDFKQVLEAKKTLVWPEIKNYLDQLLDFDRCCQIPRAYQPVARFHQKLVCEYPERKGKYLRPTLVLLTASAMGYPEKKAIKTAAAMQVSEDWILNHDDVEDDSLMRRGKPALHRLYGPNLAFNAGDALHVMMWQILKDNLRTVGGPKGQKILTEFCQMLQRTTLGQTTEIKWIEENKQKLTDQDILFVIESKTVYYTIAGPMRLGAILAGTKTKQLDLLYEFGRPVGRCFQIVDDLLDLTSDFEGQKKQQGNDIYEGKRTIMLGHLFRTVKGEDKKKLVKIMKKSREQKTASEVKWVIKAMAKHGSLAYGQNMAAKFAKQAQDIFDQKLGFLACQPARDQLRSGIDFILQRKH